jgi:hypothetical protein
MGHLHAHTIDILNGAIIGTLNGGEQGGSDRPGVGPARPVENLSATSTLRLMTMSRVGPGGPSSGYFR